MPGSWLIDDGPGSQGCRSRAKAAAREARRTRASARPDRPVWRFTLQAPSQEPFMTYLEDAGA